MSLNIGAAGVEACAQLKGNPNFAALREALRQLSAQKTDASLDSEPKLRKEATAYARALRDLFLALESATEGVHQRLIERPKRSAAA